VKDLALGDTFSCALTTNGGVWCWGRLVGVHVMNHFTPFLISGLESGVKAISAGRTHLCALTTTGGVKCLGSNTDGQLGDGTFTDSDDPVDVTGVSGVTAIDAGGFHTCALTSAGAVKCWGDDEAGQLGDGGNQNQNAPVTVTGLGGGSGQPKATVIATGAYNTCALVASTAGGNAALCWGMNYEGQLGNGINANSNVPVQVSGLESGVTAITVGGGFVCAIMTGGGVNCWGDNLHGALGEGSTGFMRSAPWPVSGLNSPVTSLSAGGNINMMNVSATTWGHVCSVTASENVFCWGQNDSGQLGNQSTTSSSVPVYVVTVQSTNGHHFYLPVVTRSS
jgi:alpha-tubulin suppressor-like RCC1 family protein